MGAIRRTSALFSALFTFLLLAHVFLSPIWAAVEEEEFAEGLLLKPLPDRKVLAHFHFHNRAPPSASNGRHHHVFPKAVAQLVQKFSIQEMELSFTQGRWSYERWGASDSMSSTNAKPPGVELWAIFDLPADQVDVTWKDLTHALSGLFCTSINFLESSTAYSSPRWGFKPNSTNLRYGALPREAVCTENLTPWLKLLPCRDKAGIASLLDRPSIYKGFYHSQRLWLSSTESAGILAQQSLTVVLQSNERRTKPVYSSEPILQPNWSISSLFRRKLTGRCVLAKSSSIFVEIEKGLTAEHESGPKNSWSDLGFDLSLVPDNVIKTTEGLDAQAGSIIYEYDVHKYNENRPLDIGISWKRPLIWPCSKAPLLGSRFLVGSGNERGSIAISLQGMHSYTNSQSAKDGCMLQVSILQIVPWYVKVYYHTLQFFIDGKVQNISDVIEKIHVSPSEDKVSPGTMELMLTLPCKIKSATLIVDFDKGFLHIDEYPPDANQGFDIPSAVISFPNFYASINFPKESFPERYPLLHSMQERSFVRSYTEVLLVPLTTPDFSMPYNVITFTCTVLALYFGSLLNVLRRRVGEEDRLLRKAEFRQGLLPRLLSKLSSKLGKRISESSKSPSTQSSLLGPKLLLKVVLVAGIAVLWHYFSE